MRENLKAARTAKGMTQQQVAEHLGISLRHYQRMESGEIIGFVELWDDLEDLFSIHQRKLREDDRGSQSVDSPRMSAMHTKVSKQGSVSPAS